MQVYKRKNETHMALTHFSWATDLDPKGDSGTRRHIKEAIDPATTSLSLLPAPNSQEDRTHQPSTNVEQGTHYYLLYYYYYYSPPLLLF